MADADGSPGSNPNAVDRAAVEALVAAAIEALERGERDPVPALCAARPELVSRVHRRLAQLAERGLIPAPPVGTPDAIGPYRIVRELGSGGMGAVYLAEQREPVHRQVALKVVKLGMDTREVVARFEAERQALAQMNHPHIAQVFDAGITPQGRPFFAMEYVAGEVLTSFCAARALPIEARVQLLATVARAVQHAHDRGFVHRDLKPSNVLVAEHDGVFMPKVIDFGIAKATAAAGAGGGTGPHTRADQVLGTPEYMSPEQACSGGADVDARTDVYSLGAVLYELLCGELPFASARLRQATRTELEHILQDELPPPPSRRLPPRGTTVTSLRRRIAGELDWITLKALAKERERRYATPLAFAEDLERWLRDEPVLAGPPTWAYRLRKFARRHRTSVVAAALLVLLSVGAAWALRARSADAEQHYREAKVAVDRLLQRATDERMRRASQNDAMRQELAADALSFYDHWLRERPADARLRIGRIDALIALSQVHWQMGQLAAAEATAREATEDARALLAEQPGDLVRRSLLAESLRRLGRAIHIARRDDPAAREAFTESVTHLEACCEQDPARHALSLSSALRELASTLDGPDDGPASLDACRRSVAAIERLVALGAPAATAVHDLAVARTALVAQLLGAGQLDAAEAVLVQAERDLPRSAGDRAQIELLLQQGRGRLAMRRGDDAAATARFVAMVAAAEQWCRDEPGRMLPQESLLGCLGQLAAHHERGAAFAAADDVQRRRIALAEAMVRDFPDDVGRVGVLARALRDAAAVLWNRYRRADLDQALAWARQAAELRAGMQASDGQTPPHWWFAVLVASIRDARGEPGDADWEAVAAELPSPPRSPGLDEQFDAWLGVAENRLRGDRFDAVATALAAAAAIVDRVPTDGGKRAAALAWLRGRVALRQRDAAAAAVAAEDLLAARPTWWGQWHAGDCWFGAWQLAPGDVSADAWLEHAAESYGNVVDTLAGDVARDADDPWPGVPWGCSGVQLARIEAARGDPAAARRRLGVALPALERVRDAAHRDVWQPEVWQRGIELRRALDGGR